MSHISVMLANAEVLLPKQFLINFEPPILITKSKSIKAIKQKTQ